MNPATISLPTTDPGKSTILIIDDNAANLAVLTEHLHEHGFGILIAKDGQNGLERARLTRPDLILLDVDLPDMDGFEVCRHLKQTGTTSHIPVIFLTAHATNTAYKVKGFELGAVDYVEKPVQQQELLARITTHLRLQNLTQKLRQQTLTLQQAEQRYRTLFEGAPLMYIVTREQEGVPIITGCNQMFLETLGYSSEQVLEQPVAKFYTPESQRRMQQEGYQRVLAGQPIIDEEREFITQDGRVIQTMFRALPDFNEQGEMVGIRASYVDITARKQAERALQEYQNHLEELIAERTATLAQTVTSLEREIIERIRVEEQLQASLQEKEVLLKEVHHRVKNNMQIISSLLDLQAGNIKDAQVRELFKESRQRIRSMALIHERLYQSQDLAHINFAEYITNLVNHIRQSYGARAAAITIQVKADPILLDVEQAIPCGLIINELVSNTLKHAFPDGRAGEVWVKFQAAAPHQLLLQVGDNGIGFPTSPDLLHTKSLGLTLVNTLVKQIKGTIELDCQNGTEFKITLPDPSAPMAEIAQV